MTFNSITRLFGIKANSASNIAKRKRMKKRTLHIEELEGREMLSVTPFDTQYESELTYIKGSVWAAFSCTAARHSIVLFDALLYLQSSQ